jgi:hypothetical protein
MKNLWSNFLQIFLKTAEKWENFFEVCSLHKKLTEKKFTEMGYLIHFYVYLTFRNYSAAEVLVIMTG